MRRLTFGRLQRWRRTPPATEHHITDLAGWHGGYQCCCGLPWLIFGDRCMTQPTSPTTEEDPDAE